jgi:hypothetical protein
LPNLLGGLPLLLLLLRGPQLPLLLPLLPLLAAQALAALPVAAAAACELPLLLALSQPALLL